MRSFLASQKGRDLAVVVAVVLLVWFLATGLQLFDRLYQLTRAYQNWNLGELLLLLLFLPLPLLWYAARRALEAGRTARQLVALEREESQSNKVISLEVLANGLSHELNNELQPVIGLATLLEQEIEQQDPRRRHAELIVNGAMRSRDTIVRVMGLSDTVQSTPSPIAVSLPLHNLMETLASSCPNAIRLRAEIDDDVPVPNIAWPELETIVRNLTTNAIEGMEEGGGTLTVQLQRLTAGKAAIPGYCARLTVQDSGRGIPRQAMSKVFDPYFTSKPVGMGAGLGLWQVHSLVSRAGGRLDLTSIPEKGTTVAILLPAMKGRPPSGALC